jgi:hypothetical protein
MAGERARRLSLVLRRPAADRRTASLETVAREAGMHPDLVLRFVRLGLVEPVAGTQRQPLFARDAAPQLARAVRLRRDFGMDYAGAVLAGELLARIDRLERRLARYEQIGLRSNSPSRPSYTGGAGGTSVQRPRTRK